jgi:hypothetical protein
LERGDKTKQKKKKRKWRNSCWAQTSAVGPQLHFRAAHPSPSHSRSAQPPTAAPATRLVDRWAPQVGLYVRTRVTATWAPLVIPSIATVTTQASCAAGFAPPRRELAPRESASLGIKTDLPRTTLSSCSPLSAPHPTVSNSAPDHRRPHLRGKTERCVPPRVTLCKPSTRSSVG